MPQLPKLEEGYEWVPVDNGQRVSSLPDPGDGYEWVPVESSREFEETSVPREFKKGLTAGVQQLRGMGYGLGALAGEATGIDAVKEWSAEGLADVEKKTPLPFTPSYADVTDISDLGNYLAYGIASNIPNMALSFTGGGVGAVSGKMLVKKAAEEAAKTALKQGASKEVALAAGKAVIDKAIKTGAFAGASTSSIGMESGMIAGDQLQETGKVDPLRALAGGIPAGLLDVVPEWYLAKRLGWLGKGAAEFKGNRLARAGKVAGQQFAMEAPTEAMQSVIERASVPGKSMTNAEAWDEYINSFILGGATGGVLGGAGGMFTKASQKPGVRPNDQQEPPVSPTDQSDPGQPPPGEPPPSGGFNTAEDFARAYTEGTEDFEGLGRKRDEYAKQPDADPNELVAINALLDEIKSIQPEQESEADARIKELKSLHEAKGISDDDLIAAAGKLMTAFPNESDKIKAAFPDVPVTLTDALKESEKVAPFSEEADALNKSIIENIGALKENDKKTEVQDGSLQTETKIEENPVVPLAAPPSGETVTGPSATEAAPAKEPWEITGDSFVMRPEGSSFSPYDEYMQRQGFKGEAIWRNEDKINAKRMHHTLVATAISEGKPVPPEVLKDYPDLQKPEAKAKVEGKKARHKIVKTKPDNTKMREALSINTDDDTLSFVLSEMMSDLASGEKGGMIGKDADGEPIYAKSGHVGWYQDLAKQLEKENKQAKKDGYSEIPINKNYLINVIDKGLKGDTLTNTQNLVWERLNKIADTEAYAAYAPLVNEYQKAKDSDNAYIEQQQDKFKAEGIDAESISNSQEQLEAVSIDEIEAQERDLTDEEIANLSDDASDFFTAVTEPTKKETPKGNFESGELEGFGYKDTWDLTNPETEISPGLRQQTTPKNEDIPFTRTPATTGLQTTAVQSTVDKVTSSLSSPPKINVVQSNKDCPAEVQKVMEREGITDAMGFTHNGEVYLVADNLDNAQEVLRTLAHELTHSGLGKFFQRQTKGKIMPVRVRYEALMDSIYRAHSAEVEKLAKTTHTHLNTRTVQGRRQACEEWLCNQTYEAQPKWYDKLVAIFNDLLRAAGIDVKLSDAEVRVVLQDAFKEFGETDGIKFFTAQFQRRNDLKETRKSAISKTGGWNTLSIDNEIRNHWKTKLEEQNERSRDAEKNTPAGARVSNDSRNIRDEQLPLSSGEELGRLLDRQIQKTRGKADSRWLESAVLDLSFQDTPEYILANKLFSSFGYTVIPIGKVEWLGLVNHTDKIALVSHLTGDSFSYFMSHEISHILSNQGNPAITAIKENLNTQHPDFMIVNDMLGMGEDFTRDEIAASIAGGWDKYAHLLTGANKTEKIRDARNAVIGLTDQATSAKSSTVTKDKGTANIPAKDNPMAEGGRDAIYLNLSKNPTKNKYRLQQIVDEAAKEMMSPDGDLMELWHVTGGSGGSGINSGRAVSTSFDDGTHFFENEWAAIKFAEKSGGRVVRAMVDIQNPKRVDDIGSDWLDELVKLDEKQDGLVYENEYEGGGDSYVIAYDFQAVVADPVIYDKNGKVIPLSERFELPNPTRPPEVGGQDVNFQRKGDTLALPSKPLATPEAKKAWGIVEKADSYTPQEDEIPIKHKMFFHSGTGDVESIRKNGIEPTFGDWVQEVLSGATEDEINIEDNFVPLSYYADLPNWLRMQTARKLKKTYGDVTRDDIKNHGYLAVVDNIDDKYGEANHDDIYQVVGDSNGPQTIVENAYGEQKKIYETDLYEEGVFGNNREPFGIEPGDFVTASNITPDVVLTGDALLEFMDAYKAKSPDIRFQRREQEAAEQASEPTPPDYDLGAYESKRKEIDEYVKRARRSIELPELVGLARELMSGKLPMIYSKLRSAFGNSALGKFIPQGEGSILLKAGIFNDIETASKVLAHEIGHLVDYLPNHMMSRGNILGRIASLNKYMKNYLEEFQGAPGVLTDADRKRLQKEAREQIKSEERPAEVIVEEIIKEIPKYEYSGITPEIILDLMKGRVEGKVAPELYEYLQRADTKEKKQIVLQAMKQLVDERVAQFGTRTQIGTETVRETVERVIPGVKADQQTIYKRFKELLKAEIDKRVLYRREVITDELKKLTKLWTPFNDSVDSAYRKYRWSSKELYADAFSVFINYPQLMQREAPTFHKAFLSWIESKPEVKEAYDGFQELSKDREALLESRAKDFYTMQEEGEDVADEIRKKLEADKKLSGKGILRELYKGLIDRDVSLMEAVKKLKKAGRVAAANSLEYFKEERNYLASEADAYLEEVRQQVLDPLKKAGFTEKDMGYLGFLMRTATQRRNVANPGGISGYFSDEQIEHLKSKWGEERFNTLKGLLEKFSDLRQEFIIKKLEEAGMYSPELMETLKTERYYLTFDVIKFMDTMHGADAPNVLGKIYHTIGTFQKIGNPFIRTIFKDISLLRAAEITKYKKELHKTFSENEELQDQIQPAEKKFNGTAQVFVEPKDPKMGMIKYLKNGKIEAFYITKEIADDFNRTPIEAMHVLKFFNAMMVPVKALLVNRNPIWMFRNVVRDYMGTVQNIPGATMMNVLPYYRRAFVDAWQEVMQGKKLDVVQTMKRGKMLVIDRQYNLSDDMSDETEFDKLYANFGHHAEKQRHGLIEPLAKAWDFLGDLGKVSERAGKVAGYRWMKENTNMTEREIGHVVRSRIGTPDVYRRGAWQLVTNNLFLYSNVGKEGFRSSWESFQDDKAAYMWKLAKYNLLPKAVLALAAMGALGDDAEDILKRISNYDKANYLVIPFGKTADGKAVYARIPQSYIGQFWGGIAWDLFNLEFKKAAQGVTADQPYSFNPVIKAALNWGLYAMDVNPQDWYRGQSVVNRKEWEAGEPHRLMEMSKNTWNSLGGGLIYKFNKSQDPKGVWEEISSLPGLNILGSFFKESNQGMKEKYSEAVLKGKQESALKSLAKDPEVARRERNKREISKAKSLLKKGIIDYDDYREAIKRYR